MEIKALGQLHFKYYAEVKEVQRMYEKTSAQMFMTLWKEVFFTAYQAFGLLDCGMFVHLLFSCSETFFYHMKDVRLICL